MLKNKVAKSGYTKKTEKSSIGDGLVGCAAQFAIIMCTLKKESMDFDTPRLPNTVHRNIIEG